MKKFAFFCLLLTACVDNPKSYQEYFIPALGAAGYVKCRTLDSYHYIDLYNCEGGNEYFAVTNVVKVSKNKDKIIHIQSEE